MANELLAKREEERGRKRDLEDPDPYPSKRARSTSHSVDSVSTISTQRSLSESPPREGTGPKSSRDRVGSTSPPRSTPKKRRHSDSSSGYSTPPYSSADSRSRSRDPGYDRSIRRRHRKSSPGERGRPRHSPIDGGRQHRPRSHSMDKSRIAKSRRSMTPETRQRDNYSKRPLPPRDHSRRTSNYPERGRGSAPAQPRDPSLSPYSKRLALTQAMNLGR